MSTVKLPDPHTAPEPVRRFIEGAKERFRFDSPNNMGRVLAAIPDLLPAYLDLGKWYFGPGRLSRAQRELVGTCVSAVNACHY